jgi:hypothetical protein
MPKAKSKAQFRLFGALAGKGVKWARNSQRGRKIKGLPARAGGGKKKR